MIYLLVLILILIPFVKYDLFAKKSGEIVWYYVVLFALIALAAFRYRVGGDTIIYMDIFEYYPKISELSKFDFKNAEFNPMWYVYNSVFKSFCDNFFVFQLTQAIIVNTIFLRFFYRYCNRFFCAVLIYFLGYYCYFNMEILREVLSICIFLLAFPFLEKREWFKYYLLVLFAISIHYSSVILLFIPLLLLLKRDRFWISLITSLIVVVLLNGFNILDIIIDFLFGKQSKLIIRYILLRNELTLNGVIIQSLICLPLLILFYFRRKYSINNNSNMGSILNAFIFIQSISISIIVISRFNNYLIPIMIVFVVNTIFENFDKIRSSQIARFLVFSVLLVFCFNISYGYLKNRDFDLYGSHMYDRYLPYKSIFNPEKSEYRERLMINERSDNDETNR